MSFYHALLGRALAGGGGGSEPVLISKSISSNGTYDASDDNADGYSSVSVSVPNTYTAADDGKVVSNGSLVAQGSDTVTQNGTVDTTLISSLIVNVSGGSGGLSQIAKLIPDPLSSSAQYITSSDLYILESDNYFYLIGTMNLSTSITSDFLVPSSFDTSKLGSFIKGTKHKLDTTTASNCTVSWLADSNLIRISDAFPVNTIYDAVWNKTT